MNNTPQFSNKNFKTLTINSFIGYIIIGIWALILVLVMLNKIKAVSVTGCIQYNSNNQCIKYN